MQAEGCWYRLVPGLDLGVEQFVIVLVAAWLNKGSGRVGDSVTACENGPHDSCHIHRDFICYTQLLLFGGARVDETDGIHSNC